MLDLLFPVALTFGAFQIGLWCQKKWKNPLCNPILIAAVLIIGFLLATGYSNEAYQKGTAVYQWLLTPATVCLALPLYRQLKILGKNLWAILAGVTAGTITSLLCVFFLAKIFSLDRTLLISLLPKSVTTAMGMALSEQLGGIGAISAAAIIVTGILGSLTGSVLCKLLRLKDPISQGVAFGTASHVIGTSRATELGALQGAVSSLSLAVAGILTAILMPILCMFL